MLLETTTLATLAATALILTTAGYIYLRSGRSKIYRRLADRHAAIDMAGGLPLVAPADVPSFEQKLAVIDNVLPPSSFSDIATEIEKLVETERSYLPTHKKGGTVAYETLIEKAPNVVALYHSAAMQALVSNVVGERVEPTPLHDQSSLSVLFYEKPGDHIGWHYDHNFYKGRHFTVLIPIVNRGAGENGLSQAQLSAKLGREEITIATPPNRMIMFEGAKVVHKVTPIGEGERRVVLSMTYCTDPRNSLAQGVARRIKDTAFFGLRALWT
jgi:hypothetical protein